MTWASDGRLLATCSGRIINLLEPIENKLEQQGSILQPQDTKSIAFKPGGTDLAASSMFTVNLWDVKVKKLLSKFEGAEGPISSIAWSTDGKMLVCGSWDSFIYIWDSATAKLKKEFQAANDWVMGVAFSYDGSLLASTSKDGIVRIWSCREWEMCAEIRQEPGKIGGIAFHPYKYILATHDKQGHVVNVWRLAV